MLQLLLLLCCCHIEATTLTAAAAATTTGSYRYMAPEVFRHEPYNSRVDVYSFSMIVYQLFEASVVCQPSHARGSAVALNAALLATCGL